MLRAIQKRLRNKKGFTLVELIVVIAVLGVLAGIAVPRFSGMQERAQQRADEANEKMLNNAIEIYYAENGSYPREDTIGNFITDMDIYLPAEGIPAIQETGHHFIYDRDDDDNKVTISDSAAGNGELELVEP